MPKEAYKIYVALLIESITIVSKVDRQGHKSCYSLKTVLFTDGWIEFSTKTFAT